MVQLERSIDADLQEWRAWDRQNKARRWLADNVRRATCLKLTEREILLELGSITTHSDPVSLLNVLCEIVEEKGRKFQGSVASVLAHLAVEHPGPGPDAVAVDRALQRLLHRLPEQPGRPMAIACLRSDRRHRRWAAWKYYRRYGVDDESCDLLAAEFPVEAHVEFRKLVANDTALVSRLGADSVAEVAPDRYWRSRVVEAVLPGHGHVVDQLRDAYPAEWLWAVSRLGDETYLPSVLALLRQHPDDADLVNRVLLCVASLGNTPAIDEAIAAAGRILDQPEEPRPE